MTFGDVSKVSPAEARFAIPSFQCGQNRASAEVTECSASPVCSPRPIVEPNHYLMNINRDIEDLSSYLQSDPQLLEPRDRVFIRLEKLSLDYHKCMQQAFASHTAPKEELLLIANATYFDTESFERTEAPNSLLVLIVLLQFLIEKKDRTAEETRLYKQIKSSIEILSMIQMSQRYLKPYHKQVRQLMIEWVISKIDKLKVGDEIGLPGGWRSLTDADVEGHFMFNALKRTSKDTFMIKRINTHHVSPNLPVSPCEQVSRKKAHIRSFVTNLIDCYLEENLRRRVSMTSPMKRKEFLFKINRGAAGETPIHLIFPLQNDTPNCCFMVMFILFQSLHLQQNGKANSTEKEKEGAYRKAILFREEFQAYLSKSLLQSEVAV